MNNDARMRVLDAVNKYNVLAGAMSNCFHFINNHIFTYGKSPKYGGVAMNIVHVWVHVKPDCIGEFVVATLKNAEQSLKEPGIAKFDVIQQTDDKTRFILVEVYRSDEAASDHKQTSHYMLWRDQVAEMMAEPRFSIKYINHFPVDSGW
jgi:quinol monooxygenase YgiN